MSSGGPSLREVTAAWKCNGLAMDWRRGTESAKSGGGRGRSRQSGEGELNRGRRGQCGVGEIARKGYSIGGDGISGSRVGGGKCAHAVDGEGS